MNTTTRRLGMLLAILVLTRPAASQPPLSRPLPVQLPSFTSGGLPATGNPGSMARVTDGVRGLWIDQGQQWVGVDGERLNVREFGATGSGVSDDTAAIQSAINAAAVGDAIIFPNGTYLVTGLTIGKRLTLLGWGGATLKANSSTRGTTLLSITTAANEALIIGLRFAGNDLMRAIDVDSAQRILITNNRFDNRFWGQTLRLRSAHLSRVYGNFFEWEGKQGPDGGPDANVIISLWQSDRVEVHRNQLVGLNTITDATRAQRGIFSQLGNGVSIVGNTLKHHISTTQQTGTPIAMWAAAGTPKRGGVITNNQIDGGFGNQIYVKNQMYGVVISGNVITNANGAGGSAALVCADQSDYCVITGNTVSGSSNEGDGVNIRAQNLAPPAYSLIQGNTIQGTARNGISVEGFAHRIVNNIVRNSAMNQVVVQAKTDAAQIYDNHLEGGTARIADFGTNTAFRNNGGLTSFSFLLEKAPGSPLVRIDPTGSTTFQGTVFVRQGSSAQINPLVGTASINVTPMPTTATTRQVLAAYSLPPNSLSAKHTGLRITAWATTAQNANAKSFGLNVGATNCAAQTAVVNGGTMRFEVTLFKLGMNSQQCSGFSTASTGALHQIHATLAEIESQPITIGVWAHTPTLTRDLTFRSLWVEFIN
jgi:hypothetical protein